MKYFTIKELCKSTSADLYGIDNTPDSTTVKNLTDLINNILDPLREAYGSPIIVNSGYRCEKLNNKVKGAKTSQHLYGMAADITAKSASENKKLFELVLNLNLPFDLLIDEYNFKWIHVSYSNRNRRQVLHIK